MVRYVADRLYIEIYSIDGMFLGYIKSVSMARLKVESTKSKFNAKSYAKRETAYKEKDRIEKITRGTLISKIV